jgi:2-succinyl-5-enolpyruvyl-6-hydroxy-3-cyclohexene-1-carboxylate synthase
VLVGDAFGDPAARLDAVLPAGLPDATPLGESGYADRWAAADEAARQAVGEALGGDLTEPMVAARVAVRVPPDGALVVASSMPIRDVECFSVAIAQPAPVYANRGANGIDGTVSTAFGVAAATAGPTVLLTGDLALLHDIGGLHAAKRTRTRLVIVALDNDGGGIFHFLPVAGHASIFEEHVATPHGLDLSKAAGLYGLDCEEPLDLAAFDAALERALGSQESTLIIVRTDRAENVEVHRRAVQAVARSVRHES